MLDPIERASEAIFGVLMPVSVTGSPSAATSGRQEIRTMLLTAVGGDIAWGLTDTVMYPIGAATEKRRRTALLHRLHETTDRRTAQRMIADELPERLAGGAGEEALEAFRKALVAIPETRLSLPVRDFSAALGVFAIVVLATFPVVVPFLFMRNVAAAMRVSDVLPVAPLYAYGHAPGQHAGGQSWGYGFVIAAIGMILVAIIMALGG